MRLLGPELERARQDVGSERPYRAVVPPRDRPQRVPPPGAIGGDPALDGTDVQEPRPAGGIRPRARDEVTEQGALFPVGQRPGHQRGNDGIAKLGDSGRIGSGHRVPTSVGQPTKAAGVADPS